jgi:hypothetical protein
MSKELEKKLRSMKKEELKKEIAKHNKPLKGYTKLNKEGIIQLMLKYKDKFMYLTTPKKNKQQLLALKKARIAVKKSSIQQDKELFDNEKKIVELRKKLAAMKAKNN